MKSRKQMRHAMAIWNVVCRSLAKKLQATGPFSAQLNANFEFDSRRPAGCFFFLESSKSHRGDSAVFGRQWREKAGDFVANGRWIQWAENDNHFRRYRRLNKFEWNYFFSRNKAERALAAKTLPQEDNHLVWITSIIKSCNRPPDVSCCSRESLTPQFYENLILIRTFLLKMSVSTQLSFVKQIKRITWVNTFQS